MSTACATPLLPLTDTLTVCYKTLAWTAGRLDIGELCGVQTNPCNRNINICQHSPKGFIKVCIQILRGSHSASSRVITQDSICWVPQIKANASHNACPYNLGQEISVHMRTTVVCTNAPIQPLLSAHLGHNPVQFLDSSRVWAATMSRSPHLNMNNK